MQQVVGAPEWPKAPLLSLSPDSLGTLGDTARHLATYTPAALMHRDESWTRREIEAVITELLTVEVGIESFDWDDHFVRDLRID
jgi:hypothetical protein